MLEADMSMTNMAIGQTAEEDKSLAVKFYLKSVQDEEKSNLEGRPIHVEREFVKIIVPGDPNHIDTYAENRHRKRFPQHYAAFKARTDQDAERRSGTPLAAWPPISRTQVEELKFFEVYTVENLADVSDSNAQRMMGLMNLREKAKDFLARANSDKSSREVNEILESQRSLIESMAAEKGELLERIEALEAGKPKPRGRPKKVVEPAQE